MLTTAKTKILESLEDWQEFVDQIRENPYHNPSNNKLKLLEMARNGYPRPNGKKTKLGSRLNSYINKKKSYDPNFYAEIREIAPNWLVNKSDIANQKKEQLLEMARNGEPKPKKNTKLGDNLVRYTNKKKECYDPEFDAKIRELRPDWFITQSDVANEKKKQLLEMARNGDSKPNYKTKLGRCFYNYTDKKNGCYDPEFDKQIREIRPDWFINTADENKKQLLEMARNGESKPSRRKTKLGECFRKYTSKGNSCYDPEFDAKIRKLAPHWFRK